MHTMTVGKWCGYCGNFVNDQTPYFLNHVNDCEKNKCEEIAKKLRDNFRERQNPDNSK